MPTPIEDAAEARAKLARMRSQREKIVQYHDALKELIGMADKAAQAVADIRGVIDPLREIANQLAFAVRRARDLIKEIEK